MSVKNLKGNRNQDDLNPFYLEISELADQFNVENNQVEDRLIDQKMDLEKAYKKIVKQVNNQSRDNEESLKRISIEKNEIEALSIEIDRKSKHSIELQKNIFEMSKKIAVLEAEIDRGKAKTIKCDKHNSQLEEEVKNKTYEYNQLSGKLQTLVSNIRDVQAKEKILLDRREYLAAKLDDVNKSSESRGIELVECEAASRLMESELESLSDMVKTAENEYSSICQQIASAKDQASKMSKELSELQTDKIKKVIEFAKQETEYQNQKEREIVLSKDIELLKNEIVELEENHSTLRKKISDDERHFNDLLSRKALQEKEIITIQFSINEMNKLSSELRTKFEKENREISKLFVEKNNLVAEFKKRGGEVSVLQEMVDVSSIECGSLEAELEDLKKRNMLLSQQERELVRDVKYLQNKKCALLNEISFNKQNLDVKNVDVLDSCQELIALQDSVVALESTLEVLINGLADKKAELDDLGVEKSTMLEQFEKQSLQIFELRKISQELTADINMIRAELENREIVFHSNDQLINKSQILVSGYSDQIVTCKRNNQDLIEKIEKQTSEIERFEAESERCEVEIERLNESIDNNITQLLVLEKKHGVLLEEVNINQKFIRSRRDDCQALTDTKMELSNTVVNLEHQLDIINREVNQCNDKIAQDNALVEKLTSRKEELEVNLCAQRDALKTIDEQKSQISEMLQQLDVINKSFIDGQTELKLLEERKGYLDAEIMAKRELIEEKKEKHQILLASNENKKNNVKQIDGQIDELDFQIQEIEREINLQSDLSQKIDSRNMELEVQAKKKSEILSNVGYLKREIEVRLNELNTLDQVFDKESAELIAIGEEQERLFQELTEKNGFIEDRKGELERLKDTNQEQNSVLNSMKNDLTTINLQIDTLGEKVILEGNLLESIKAQQSEIKENQLAQEKVLEEIKKLEQLIDRQQMEFSDLDQASIDEERRYDNYKEQKSVLEMERRIKQDLLAEKHNKLSMLTRSGDELKQSLEEISRMIVSAQKEMEAVDTAIAQQEQESIKIAAKKVELEKILEKKAKVVKAREEKYSKLLVKQVVTSVNEIDNSLTSAGEDLTLQKIAFDKFLNSLLLDIPVLEINLIDETEDWDFCYDELEIFRKIVLNVKQLVTASNESVENVSYDLRLKKREGRISCSLLLGGAIPEFYNYFQDEITSMIDSVRSIEYVNDMQVFIDNANLVGGFFTLTVDLRVIANKITEQFVQNLDVEQDSFDFEGDHVDKPKPLNV